MEKVRRVKAELRFVFKSIECFSKYYFHESLLCVPFVLSNGMQIFIRAWCRSVAMFDQYIFVSGYFKIFCNILNE